MNSKSFKVLTVIAFVCLFLSSCVVTHDSNVRFREKRPRYHNLRDTGCPMTRPFVGY